MPNRLHDESSPYLLQHADNPVDWFPWGEEALDRARREDRPILLSIGYSACHWCHVMEHESFEDESTAALMNESFVNVKVDREERPDLDQIYMKAVQAMTGSGGWPLTAFLTPEGVPYYGGTYFPPEPRYGMPSFRQVLAAAGEAYRDRPDDVRAAGERLLAALRQVQGAPEGDIPARSEWVGRAARVLASRYDSVHGGFGAAPKFPQPVTLELMLHEHLRTGEPAPLEMAVHTLRRMAAGGMRDHLGGGFHRYSVDERWLVPHFEKMLYDNVLLARVYASAYLLTGDEELREVAEDTLEYVAEDLHAPEGGFWSARDADSEGEEGTFYVWRPEEIDAHVDPEDAAIFRRLYDVTDGGNFEGRSILHLPHPPAVVARSVGISEDELAERMARGRAALLEARAEREPPFRDEKILTSWSAMAARAFVEVGATLGRWDFVTIGTEAADFLWTTLRPEGRLLRVHKDGVSKIPAFLEDYAALGNALLSVHAATLDPRWLRRARTVGLEMRELFFDEASGEFHDTAHDAEKLVLRPRDVMDNATPSGNSMAAEFYARAGHLFDDADYRRLADQIVAADSAAIVRYGPAFGRMLSVVDRLEAPPVEVAIVGESTDEATRALVQAAHSVPVRNLTIAGKPPLGTEPEPPLLAGRSMVDGRPAAYVCRNFSCRLPLTDATAVKEQMAAP